MVSIRLETLLVSGKKSRFDPQLWHGALGCPMLTKKKDVTVMFGMRTQCERERKVNIKYMKKSSKIGLAVGAVVGALMVLKKKAANVAGVGAVDWDHVRWRAENELGIDFRKSYFEQSWSAMTDLANLGRKSGYRRSYDNGKSYGRAFYDAIKRKTN